MTDGRDRRTWQVLAAGVLMVVATVAAHVNGRQAVAPPEVIWLTGGRPNAAAREALALLRSSADDGVRPADYDMPALIHLATSLEVSPTTPVAADLVAFDARLTAAMVGYVRHVHQGRVDPRTIGLRLRVPDDHHDFTRLVREAASANRLTGLVDAFRPATPQYGALRKALRHYRTLAEPALALPQVQRAVHPGERYGATALLRERLRLFGDLGSPASGDGTADDVYGGGLVEALRRFQERHGLDADGVLGKQTVAALNVSVRWRRRQIELALERVRWLPHLTRPRVLVLNIPMFELWGWRPGIDRVPSFSTTAVVGKALQRATPVMADEMREVIFRPFWNVPRSIVRSELLPLLERDPAYLAREEMEIVAGDGDDAEVVDASADALARLSRGELRLRQRPGARNALGLVKFAFPNEDQVYLHDTPARALFARSRRDFSHGCVRVADAIGLAAWVLADQGGWSRDRIAAALAGPGSEHARLDTPVQVLLLYTTAAVMPDGRLRFAHDIYHYDDALDRALAGGSV